MNPTAATDLLVPQIPTLALTSQQLIVLAWQIGPALLAGILVGLGLTLGRTSLITKLAAGVAKLTGKSDPELTGWQAWVFHTLSTLKGWFIWSSALYVAIRLAPPAHPVWPVAEYIYSLLSIIQLGLALVTIVKQVARAHVAAHKADGARVTLTHTMVMVVKMLIWVFMALLAMSASGINVTALLAGLGIGGVAIAFAFKSILEDIFGSLSVVMDKPFVIGDFIIAGDYMGSVEHIGMKTTRIRSISGEQIIISNSDLLGSRIRNFGRMEERRQVFTVGVVYETPVEKLEKIPGIIRGIVEAQKQVRFDRCHFAKYGTFSLDFETVYFVTSPDYTLFMDTQQAINLAILRALEAEGVQLAYPTQVIYARANEGEKALPDGEEAAKPQKNTKKA
jgi:small-conductance mechanosensitive channel